MRTLLKNYEQTPEWVASVVDELEDNTKFEDLLEFRMFVTERLRSTLVGVANSVKGKKITVILDSLIRELPDLTTSNPEKAYVDINTGLFLEKYIIDKNTPTIVSTYTYPYEPVGYIKEEMLAMFKTVGVKQTVLFYLLVIYHTGK